MFTGIIAATGTVTRWGHGRLHLAIESKGDGQNLFHAEPFALGESISVDGCCLTVVEPNELVFDVAPETIRRTTIGHYAVGRRVNLERAMRPSDRFGGHIVQGHVDGVAEILSRREDGNSTVFRFAAPDQLVGGGTGGRYLVDRGSVAIDGISLTVANPFASGFEVWVIPHTLQVTTLADKKEGDHVNIEFDEVAKWVERLIQPYR